MVVGGTFICAIGAAALAVIPNGAWLLFAVLRFFVGFGLGASFAPATTMVVELTPTRHRTVVSSLFVLSASVGGFLASATVAALLGLIGWRGIAALGVVPGPKDRGAAGIRPYTEPRHQDAQNLAKGGPLVREKHHAELAQYAVEQPISKRQRRLPPPNLLQDQSGIAPAQASRGSHG